MDSGVLAIRGDKMDVRDSESLPHEVPLRVGTFVGHRPLVGQQTASLRTGVYLVTTTSHQISLMARSKRRGTERSQRGPGKAAAGRCVQVMEFGGDCADLGPSAPTVQMWG